MRTSKKGIDLIKKYEGCSLKAYKCPANVLTIGYGHTSNVQPNQIINQEQANEMLVNDLVHFETLVNGLKLPINQNQFDAIISFCFNIGFAAFKKSSLLVAIRERNNSMIAHNFSLWRNATINGKITPLAGLISRRKSEADLFLSTEL